MDDDVAARLRDTLYTAVGLGVLGLQQAQVRRRELQKELAKLDEKVDPVLDDLEARLPEDLRPLVAPARSAAHAVLGPSGPRSGEPGPSGPRSGEPGPSGPRSGDPGPSGPRSGEPGRQP